MKKIAIIVSALLCVLPVNAQRVLTLEECCRVAVENNRQSRLAELAEKQAKLQADNTTANFLPKFSAAGGYLYADKNFSVDLIASLSANLSLNNTYAAGVQLEQPLFLGGKLLAVKKMSKIGLSVVGLNREKTDSDVRFETEKTFWDVVKAEELQKVADQYAATVEEFYRKVETFQRTGMASQNDLLKVRVKKNEALLMQRRAENSVRIVKMNLCYLMGMPLDEAFEVKNDLSDRLSVGNSVDFSVSDRVEYQILSEQIKLKEEQVKAVRSEFLPQVGVMAGYSYMNGVKMNGTKLLSDDLFAVMVSVKIPLFHWGEGARKVKSARVEQQMAELRRDEAADQMRLEVSQAANMLDEKHLEMELTQSAFEEAAECLRESRQNFEVGMETLADYLEAQADWQKAWSESVSAKIDYQVAKMHYYKAVGQR